MAALSDPAATLAVLTAALSVRVVVTKRRRLFLWGPVRIHLDDVADLGRFVEFEAVGSTDSDLSEERRLIAEILVTFRVTDDRLLAIGYPDLLEGQDAASIS